MPNWRATFVSVVFLTCGGFGQQLEAPLSLLGQWRVQDVMCSDCGKRLPTEKGSKIEFSSSKIRNPVSDDCDASPGYKLLQATTGQSLFARKGKQWPTAVAQAVRNSRTVRYGFVTCNGGNYMQVAIINDKQAYYFYEGGVVFELRRAATSGKGTP